MREVDEAAWDGLLDNLGLADAYYRRAYVESACVLEPGEPLLLEHDGTVFAAIRRPLTATVTGTTDPQLGGHEELEPSQRLDFTGTVPATDDPQRPALPEAEQRLVSTGTVTGTNDPQRDGHEEPEPRQRLTFTGTVTVTGAVDLITPYGYGGPAGGARGAFWAAYEAWARERAALTTFVRFHPLYANHRDAPIHVEQLARTIGWRLDGDLLAGMHGKHRNAVRKAEVTGTEITASVGLDAFVPLYEETMRRTGAAPFYFFPPAYWEALERLGDGLRRFDALHEGQVVASALCLASPPWLHYHLGATAEAGRKLGATALLLYEAARWAQEHGYERFHLGGGVGGGRDSLHEFKRRFDPGGECEMAIGKAVHDEAAYRALGGDPTDLSGFFPAYRRPAQ